MNENRNNTDEIIRNVEDESSEMLEQMTRESMDNVETEAENLLEEVPANDFEHEPLGDTAEDKMSTKTDYAEETVKTVKKESKQQKAKRLVEQARYIVNEADELSKECRLLLAEDLAEYEDAKINLKEHGFDSCTALLETMGYRSSFEETEAKETVVIEAKEEVAPMVIKEVSSGRFTGIFSALLAGSATAVGLVYFATEKLEMTLDISKVPSPEVSEKIASWFSTLVGMEPNVYVGTAVFGLSVAAVMAIVYSLRVTLKVNSNLHHAVKQFVEAELYAEKKADCKDAFENVEAHMKESIKTFKTYEVLFNEQQGKLKRIAHIEGEKSDASEYHEKSFREIRDTQKLIEVIKDFMAVPMSKEGKLSEESVARLETLKKEMDHMIERLY